MLYTNYKVFYRIFYYFYREVGLIEFSVGIFFHLAKFIIVELSF